MLLTAQVAQAHYWNLFFGPKYLSYFQLNDYHLNVRKAPSMLLGPEIGVGISGEHLRLLYSVDYMTLGKIDSTTSVVNVYSPLNLEGRIFFGEDVTFELIGKYAYRRFDYPNTSKGESVAFNTSEWMGGVGMGFGSESVKFQIAGLVGNNSSYGWMYELKASLFLSLESD